MQKTFESDGAENDSIKTCVVLATAYLIKSKACTKERRRGDMFDDETKQ